MSLKAVPFKANLFIFDSYGEYISALSGINDINPNLHYKLITTNKKINAEYLSIPVSLLSLDDLLNLLDATSYGQIPIIEETLNLLKFLQVKIKKYKNIKIIYLLKLSRLLCTQTRQVLR